ncbi:MAG: thermonuclease family protein [Desulfomonile tiedjei]|uniref:Thermonuclease family protein n=1 Tax=Desulfomonile tiedjei TaxID=2358 RepID=A0A9D6V140_9BACT|nr:thermonuclease family protein [Desulfomonile tiedjei]
MLDQFLGYLVEAARWLFILILTLAHPEEFTPWSGTVVQIVRPDEIKVRKNDNEIVNVRIYGVDCPLPESGQFFGKEAFSYTSDRTKEKIVQVQPLPGRIEGVWYWPGIRRLDRLHWEKSPRKYNRIIALVYVDGDSLGKELLTNGIAWWYKPFVPFERGYKHLEDEARDAKVGLWAHPKPIPPWQFQLTPVVDGRSESREWVHFWVRKDESVRAEGPAADLNGTPTDSAPEESPAKQPIEAAGSEAPTAPVDQRVPDKTYPKEHPPVSPDSPSVVQDAGTVGSDLHTPVASPKSFPACHKMLKDLESRMAKQGSLDLTQLRDILGPPQRECKKDEKVIYCFKCTVIGHKTDSIEAIETNGSVSAYRYGSCGCSD